MSTPADKPSSLTNIEYLSEALANIADEHLVTKQTKLKCAKNHFYVLRSGNAIAKANDAATELLRAGNTWNSTDLPSSTILALNRCNILSVSHSSLLEVTDQDPEFHKRITQIQSQQLQSSRLRLITIQNSEAAERVASLMLELSQDQYEFLVLPTQVELSEILGISREALNKSIRSFIKKGWMVKLGRTHKITNRTGLKEFAEKLG